MVIILNNLNRTLRVGIYLRLSNEDKDKAYKNDVSESIKNQRNMLIEYINKHPEFILIDEYSDEDLSGAGTYRPEFERLIKDCKNRKLDIVLCKSQSRFSRDMEIVERYINNKFKEWNIRFISLVDNADTLILGNKKSRQINGLVNEWYLEDVSNNIRSAFFSKMKQGEFISPFASYGYEVSKENNNKLVIDKEAALIVKIIFNLYLMGFGYMKIAKYLNDKDISSPSLYKYKKGIKLNVISNKPRDKIKWNSSAIKSILSNELYLGHLIQGKRTTVSYKNHKIINKPKKEWIKIKNTHEAIIDEETFMKVQKAMKERTKVAKNTGKIHIFSGKVLCLECDSYMRKKNSSKHEYLVCSNNQDSCCKNKSSVRYEVLENIILSEINKKIKSYYDGQLLKKEILKKKKTISQKKLSLLENQKKELLLNLSKTNNYLQNLYEDKVNNIITKEQFESLITIYNNDRDNYKEKIKFINNEIIYYKEKEKNNDNDEKILCKYQEFSKLNRIIIQEFIDKIYIGKINKEVKVRDIKIKWNFNMLEGKIKVL